MSLNEYTSEACFALAEPVWPENMELEKNITVGFRAEIDKPLYGSTILRIAASTLYRFFVNGEFTGHGPARGPHGYYRIDEWKLDEHLVSGVNIIAIEVAGYNVNSYYLLNQPSFLQAEVVNDRNVLKATLGVGSGVEVFILHERIQKVQRYSFQRTFTEAYRFQPGYDKWRSDISQQGENVLCPVTACKKLIQRNIPLSEFKKCFPIKVLSEGKIEIGELPCDLWEDRSLTDIGPELGGFDAEELEVVLSREIQKIKTVTMTGVSRDLDRNKGFSLGLNSFQILDFGINQSGFIGAKIKCQKNTKLLLVFDEVLTKGDVDFKRLNTINIVSYEMKAGVYRFETFEPYTFRYLKLILLDGECHVEDIYIREYTNPDVYKASFQCDDLQLNAIFEAGWETFRQNAVDIFMDCPSRERVGWLCDSFFMARVEYDLTGGSIIEKNFFENYLLPESFAHLPKGMLPMCYPADHNNGVFIPNWSLWFIIQLEEYLKRSNDRKMINALKPKILKLVDYFNAFKNEDGLLEKLDSWIFVEWSNANNFVQDVNYPTNMLYSGALSAIGRMYNLPEFLEEAEAVRETIRKQSFDGEFFIDNAVRENGILKLSSNKSEVCQYFAFFFDVASPATFKSLWHILINKFGPDRKEHNDFPNVHMANAFIGNYLRIEILSRYGEVGKLTKEVVDYFFYMTSNTGTLWENDGMYASCNHGFASHIVHVLYRDVLGISSVDIHNKMIKLILPNPNLNWCEGQIPLRDNIIYLKWWVEDENILYHLEAPEGYSIKIENLSKMGLICK